MLEVVKMGMYVSFPVCLFHYFNSPGNIEEDLTKAREEYIGKFIGTERFEARHREITERKAKALEERDREQLEQREKKS